MAVQPVLGTPQQVQREREREQTAPVQTAISAFSVAISLLRWILISTVSNQQRTQTPLLHVFLPSPILDFYPMVTSMAADCSRDTMSMVPNRRSGIETCKFDLWV